MQGGLFRRVCGSVERMLAAERLRVELVSPLGNLLGRDDAWSLHSVAHCSMLREMAGDTLWFSFCLKGHLEAIGIL